MKSDSSADKQGIKASADDKDFILEFDTNSKEFMRGFECGEIWACLTDEVMQVHSIITASNAEMVMRMAEATDYSYQGRYLEEDEAKSLQLGPGEWMIIVLTSKDFHE